MPKIRLTKKSVQEIPFTESGQRFYLDSTLQGYGLRVGKNSKSFFAEKRVDRKTVRVTLGRFPQILPDEAFRKAQKVLGRMTEGENPIAKKRTERVGSVTLQDAFEDYLKTKKKLKPRTVENYTRTMRVAFEDWKEKPLNAISREMASERHSSLGEKQGGAQANTHMRILKAIFNFANHKYKDSEEQSVIKTNPVVVLNETGAWYEDKVKDRIIQEYDLPTWWESVNRLESERGKDFLIFLLVTGLRKLEAAKLRWEDVSFDGRRFTILDTKNKKPLTLPLIPFTLDLMRRRKENSQNSPYVFPATKGQLGHLVNPSHFIKNVIEDCGIPFSCHDLRRTFTTIGSRLVTGYQIKAILNHSLSGDVTGLHYVKSDVEALRQPLEKITDHILRLCRVEEGKVIPIKSKRA